MPYVRPHLPPQSLTLFFPCHNEEENVERVTEEVLAVGRTLADDLEVLIVDDGSRDRTAELAAALAERIPEVRVVTHETNQGYGAALRSGFQAATKEWVFYTDGDGQFDLSELPDVLAGMGGHDIFSGYRADRQDPLHRKFNAWVWNVVIRALFGLRLRDVDCAFKVFPKRFLSEIEIQSDSPMVDTEVLAQAVQMGMSIQQKPVRHLPRLAGDSCGGKLSVILHTIREAFAIRGRLRRRAAKLQVAATDPS